MRISLTFDTEHPDKPCRPGNTLRRLDDLAFAGVKATFFIQGLWAQAYPELTQRIVRDGHAIANHSWWHASTTLHTDEGVRLTVTKTEDVLKRLTGARTRLFRPPYGNGLEDERVIRIVESLGYDVVGWDVDSEDWDPAMTADRLLERVPAQLETAGGNPVIVFHSWPDCSADALPELIFDLRRRGCEFSVMEPS